MRKEKSIRVIYSESPNPWPDDEYDRAWGYEIKYKDGKRIRIPLKDYPYPSNQIVFAYIDKPFVNGFKCVQLSNGEYGYIRESDNVLLPYRYTFATDFDEYGFAMVAKRGKVSWINSSFKCLNSDGEWVLDNEYWGWSEIHDFSQGNIPLALLGRSRCPLRYSYLGTDGNLKKFYRCDGTKIDEDRQTSEFDSATYFNEKGYAISRDEILFARGYYLSCYDLIKHDLLAPLDEEMSKQFDNGVSLTKKIERKPNQ